MIVILLGLYHLWLTLEVNPRGLPGATLILGTLKYAISSPGFPPNSHLMNNWPEAGVVGPILLPTQWCPINDDIKPSQLIELSITKNSVLLPDQIHQWGDLVNAELRAHIFTFNVSKMGPFIALPKRVSHFYIWFLILILPFFVYCDRP